jgi:tetratricopeptide (TPR) repeat protein
LSIAHVFALQHVTGDAHSQRVALLVLAGGLALGIALPRSPRIAAPLWLAAAAGIGFAVAAKLAASAPAIGSPLPPALTALGAPSLFAGIALRALLPPRLRDARFAPLAAMAVAAACAFPASDAALRAVTRDGAPRLAVAARLFRGERLATPVAVRARARGIVREFDTLRDASGAPRRLRFLHGSPLDLAAPAALLESSLAFARAAAGEGADAVLVLASVPATVSRAPALGTIVAKPLEDELAGTPAPPVARGAVYAAIVLPPRASDLPEWEAAEEAALDDLTPGTPRMRCLDLSTVSLAVAARRLARDPWCGGDADAYVLFCGGRGPLLSALRRAPVGDGPFARLGTCDELAALGDSLASDESPARRHAAPLADPATLEALARFASRNDGEAAISTLLSALAVRSANHRPGAGTATDPERNVVAEDEVAALGDALRLGAGRLAVRVEVRTAIEIALARRDHEIARRLLDEGVAAGDEDGWFHLIAGRLDLELLDPESATSFLHEAIRRRPGDRDAFYWLGRAEEARGDPDAARFAYRQALDLDPDSLAARRALGLSLATSGGDGDGLSHLLRVAAEAPDDPEVAAAIRRIRENPAPGPAAENSR